MPIGVRKVKSTTHKGVCIDMNMYVLIKVDEYERNILQLKQIYVEVAGTKKRSN